MPRVPPLGPGRVHRGPRPRGDLRALALLQRVLRGSRDLGPDRARRTCVARAAAGASAGVSSATGGRGARGGAGVIEQWRRALVLAPHTDDGEFGCGGSMARLVDAG